MQAGLYTSHVPASPSACPAEPSWMRRRFVSTLKWRICDYDFPQFDSFGSSLFLFSAPSAAATACHTCIVPSLSLSPSRPPAPVAPSPSVRPADMRVVCRVDRVSRVRRGFLHRTGLPSDIGGAAGRACALISAGSPSTLLSVPCPVRVSQVYV